MATELQAIASLLEGTFDPVRNKEAEIALRQEERKGGFSLLLLQVVATASYSLPVRLASALCFKNFIKRNWTDEDGNHGLPPPEVAAIKNELIGLMISVPAGLQAQLGEAVSVIAESDFWRKWDTLVDDLVARLTNDDARVNNGVLQVAHSIFRRWRPLFRSDELYTEINHVLSKFGVPFLTLLESTDRLIQQNKDHKEALEPAFANLNLLVKLFYDLSCQDLPPVFEENLTPISSILHKYFTYDNQLLHSSDEAESGLLEFTKAGICEVLILYVQKYEDVFGPLLGQFISSAWELLTTTSSATKYDILVSKALQFLTSVARMREHAQKFNSAPVLERVVEKVILPNLALRESDIELLEDEPIEFIRRDLEGSDADTRRRAATDFLRQLMEQFEKLVTEVVMKYVEYHLAEYLKHPTGNWKSKDTAVYLYSSIAAKGVVTTSQGVKTTNPLVNVVDFFHKNIGDDLVAEAGVEPLLKVDAIKYLYTFRSQITQEQWHPAFPLLVRHLSSPSYIVYSYATIAIERALFLTNDAGRPIFKKEDVVPLSKGMLEQLFRLIEHDEAPQKVQENEFLMRCVMRVLLVIKDGLLPILDSVLRHLISITATIGRNPSNPRFCYYHFEALGALIRFAAPSHAAKLEDFLYTPFATTLRDGVDQFMPYIFQLFAALLESNPAASLSQYYKSLIQPILERPLWESKGNIPALVRLLSAMIIRSASDMASNGQIEPILGISQELLRRKTTETYAFDLLETVITSFPVSSLQLHFVTLFNNMFIRLEKSRTDTFALRFTRFYHVMSARDNQGLGVDVVVATVDQIQQNIFAPLYTTVILPETQKLIRPLDRKTAVISLSKTLADSAAFAQRYQKGWAYTCEALLKLLENPPLPVSNMDDIFEQDVDDLSFGVGFTQLSTCRRAPVDPWPEITDLKRWVGSTMKEADARHGGRISSFVRDRLSAEARTILLSYMHL